MDEVGYATGHFGTWHLNGLRGAGVLVLGSDEHNPGVFGFDTWLSVTNFFEPDPLMSRNGLFVERIGDSSEVIVQDALDFIGRQVRAARPFFVVIWYGTPHSPWFASDEDRAAFDNLDEKSQHHYGELVAMDRSVGQLRAGLREFQVEQNTLVWFTSDNGGLAGIEPGTVGSLRGFKGSLYEGGLRVPAIVEWPAGLSRPRRTSFPAVTMDIFPTVASAVGLDETAVLQPQDGIDLTPLFEAERAQRNRAIGFRHTAHAALIDNDFKIVANDLKTMSYGVYDLAKDPSETTDISADQPEVASRLEKALERWNVSVSESACRQRLRCRRIRQLRVAAELVDDGRAVRSLPGSMETPV